ncbi:metallophosphoesterase [Devosia naphthalenivorans]|uniref:metallophosphoesterase n=1 Tax=Devosia naphthalenivorans TaxID=2082392 RepID=UPI000D36D10D|nr:metallophosphoesterase [Devosia naphthalenivorans]
MIIAQLSDIHADGSSKALARLDSVLGWLKPLQPDAIIISGDLAEVSHEQSYGDVRDRLEAMNTPFYVVPGNVDEPATMRRVFGDRFDWRAEGKLNCTAVISDEVRVIGLDATVAGAHHGDAEPVLAWLEAQLNAGGPPALVFQHQHPFFCGIDGKDRNNCRNQEALARVIGTARDTVLGLSCGHVHRPMFTRFAGLPATMAPSVARANQLRLDGKEAPIADPPGLMLHHIQESRLVSHAVMVA